MKVKEFIDELLQVADETDDLRFTVAGTTQHAEELDGRYCGEYIFDAEIDSGATLNGITRTKNGNSVEINVWI